MKSIEIVTSKVEMLLVDLFDKIDFQSISFDDRFMSYRDHIGWDGIKVPEGTWEHIGKATELTEEDWKGIVDDVLIGGVVGTGGAGGYWSYAAYDKSNLDGYDTATESGLSLLKANGILFENPFPKYFNNKFDGAKQVRKDWQQAESKVWRNCHVFIKQ